MGMFAPLSTSFLGFDRLFAELDHMLASTSTQSAGYPPLNLFKEDDGYVIELALAGFKKSQIKIEHDKKKGLLTVSGDSSVAPTSEGTGIGAETVESPKREVIRQSIAARKFVRAFTVADDLEVQEAALEDGLLTIKLKKLELEENKPLLIALK